VAQTLMIIFMLCIMCLTSLDPALAAGKKKKSKADQEVDKALEPVMQELTPLSQKSDAKGLFSPTDMSNALDVKLQLLDLMKDYATSEELIKPTFQAARLFKNREMFDDAYDFFNFIQTSFPQSPYAAQAKVEIRHLKQQLGDNYFADSAGK